MTYATPLDGDPSRRRNARINEVRRLGSRRAMRRPAEEADAEVSEWDVRDVTAMSRIGLSRQRANAADALRRWRLARFGGAS